MTLPARHMPVELTKDLLVDLGGWSVLKEARGLQEAGCVKATEWDGKLLMGEVRVGETRFYPRLNLRSTVFAESQCNCQAGRTGQVCAHAIALCLQEMTPKPEPQPEIVENDGFEPEPILKSLVLSEEKGIPIRFRILLPPNIERTASADRIMVKVEVELADGSTCSPEKLDRGRAYQMSLAHLAVASLVETWCEGKLFGLLQLNREQLSRMLKAVRGEPVVYWVNQPDAPIAWQGDMLPGVHAYLENEKPSEPQSKELSLPPPEKSKPRTVAEETQHSNTVFIDGSPNFLAIELPTRSAVDYEELLALVKEHGFKLEPSNRRWWLRDKHKTLNFLAEYYEALKEKHRARFSRNFRKQFRHLKRVDVKTSITEIGDEYEVTLKLGKNRDTAAIQTELNRGRLYWESGHKLFVIPRKTVDAFSRLQKNLDNRHARAFTARARLRLKPWQLADAESLIDEVVHHFETPATWQERSQALKNLSALKEAPVGESLSQTLRLYQKIGTAWLYHLFQYQLAGILADEMGLGKTLQALALVEALLKNHTGRVLIVCPAGLVTNWLREASKFTPTLRTQMHHGSDRFTSADEWEGLQVIITSYTTLTRDIDWICKQEFLAVIADEAQHIKNRDTQNARSLRALRARGRFLLTGTPIENSIQDLQSLFDFLLPGYLATVPKGINNEERTWYHQRMRRQAAPYILRRTKKQVAPELPEKIEQVVFC
ncbi:MAG: DEAD/DEAH box helicase family protein, partial [Verrucomicrobiae bacterium]|nr:DEAD/DEAH box helicase family protein [Verrucomicrobiae bacterium]